MAPRKPHVPIKSIAEKAKVAQRTVYRVVNGEATVAEATRRRIARLIKKSGYSLEEASRANVVFDVADIGFMQGVAVLIQKGLSGERFNNVIVNHRENRQGFLEAVAGAQATVFCSFPDDALLAEARQANPQCLLASAFCGGIGADVAVDVDDVLGGEMAARHLAALGHRRHVAVAAFTAQPNPVTRMRSFCAEMKRLAPECQIDIIEFPRLYAEIGGRFDEYMADAKEMPSAFFCTVGPLAERLPVYLEKNRGLVCPRDVGILSYDAFEYPQPTDYIEFRREQVAEWVAQLLEARVGKPPLTPVHVMLRPTLVVNGSVGRLG